ncbi:hypothetical protein Agub_g4370, partial [Astrephomene gubernaculifera]
MRVQLQAFLLSVLLLATNCASRQGALEKQSLSAWRSHVVAQNPYEQATARRASLRRQLLSSADGILTSSCDAQCQADQRQALTQLFNAWAGAGWTRRRNWLNSTASVCQWEGVLCCLSSALDGIVSDNVVLPDAGDPQCPDGAAGVVALSLASNNMTGDLGAVPWAAFSTTLLALELDDNSLSCSSSFWSAAGGLPALAALRLLSAGSNQLSGPLGGLRAPANLSAVLLPGNRLGGPLPLELLELPGLQYLDLDSNQLSGSLPAAAFSGPGALRTLHLAGNNLTGPLPGLPEGAALSDSLTLLDLSSNQLSGSLPPYLAGLALAYLGAAGNRLSGPVAPLLRASWSLLHLDLRGNQLGGSIPEDLRCRHLEYLDLGSNQLSGSLPSSLSGLRDLEVLLLGGNAGLVGELPAGLGQGAGLAFLNLRDTGMQAGVAGQAGLPEYISFSETTTSIGSGPGSLHCPQPLLRGQLHLEMSPYYWQFEGCNCGAGYIPNRTFANGTTTNTSSSLLSSSSSTTSSSSSSRVVSMTCVAAGPGPGGRGLLVSWWVIVLVVVGGLALSAALLLLLWRLVPSVVRYRAAMAKRMPPGFSQRTRGCKVTLVLTDVEGSTELWEWDTDLMAAAIDLHDHTLRSQMSKWYGYEVQTEGDAFLMAFHEPADAVGWCITTQLALLNADWDRELFRHHKACIETHESLQPTSASHSSNVQGLAQG